jgi:hypothetical protein
MQIGGQLLRERNASLAQEAARQFSASWKTGLGSARASTGAVATVRVPLGGEPTLERAFALRTLSLKDHRIDVVIVAFSGALWARTSAQAYNKRDDYQHLSNVISKLAKMRHM